MEQFLILVVLLIFIGAFIVKFSELFIAILQVLKYFAIPLIIAGVIYLGPKIIHWISN